MMDLEEWVFEKLLPVVLIVLLIFAVALLAWVVLHLFGVVPSPDQTTICIGKGC